MTNRAIALVTVVAVAAVIDTMLGPKSAPRFVWNVSESVPTGLYQVQPASFPRSRGCYSFVETGGER
jgi:type IV secretory pathway protease TraF